MSLEGSIGKIPGSFTKDEVLNFNQGNGAADAAIEFNSTAMEDYQAGKLLDNDAGAVNYSLSEKTASNDGGNCTYSCASFVAKYGSMLYPSMSLDNSSERITHGGIKSEGVSSVNMDAFTPGSLYRGASQQGTVLRGSSKRFSLPFINAYSGLKFRDTTPKK